MNAEEIAAAVWAYESRSLATGTPDEPTTREDEVAEAVWEYVTRTLTESVYVTGPFHVEAAQILVPGAKTGGVQ